MTNLAILTKLDQMDNPTAQLHHWLTQERTFYENHSACNWWKAKAAEAQPYASLEAFPGRKSEIYRHTPFPSLLAPLLRTRSSQLQPKRSPSSIEPLPASSQYGDHLHLYHNHQKEGGSRVPKGISIIPFGEASAGLMKQRIGDLALPKKDFFVALNMAYLSDGWWLDVAPGTRFDLPLYLHHYTSKLLTHQRLLITMGKGSSLTLVEYHHHLSPSPAFLNKVTEITLAPSARLVHHQLPTPSAPSHQLHYSVVEQAEASRYLHYQLSMGGMLFGHQISTQLIGARSEASFHGTYLGHNKQHFLHHLMAAHQGTSSKSNTRYKGVVSEQSSAAFSGRIAVAQGADQTIASQAHHGRQLGDQARLYMCPQLAIETNELCCSHGGTISKALPQEHYYLSSRGIEPTQAAHLLLKAFLGETLTSIASAQIREEASKIIEDKLHALCSNHSIGNLLAASCKN